MKPRSYICDVVCCVCSKQFTKTVSSFNRTVRRGTGHYCSKKCIGIAKLKPECLKNCKYCDKEYRAPNFKTRPNRGKYCSRECYNAWQQTADNRGVNHPNWKHGIQDPRNKNRVEYQQWRKAVFERDDYTCQACDERGGTLNAHHIKPFKEHPELVTELTNGITLCKECHIQVHRWASEYS